MTESALLRAIRLEAPKLGVTLFRNSTGMLTDVRGNKVRFGLAVGSSDLIGWLCSRDAGGNIVVAIFCAIEVKLPGKKPTREQSAFIAAVKAAGGIAGVAHSVEEFRALIAAG